MGNTLAYIIIGENNDKVSEEVQRYLFGRGYSWQQSGKSVVWTDKPVIVITDEGLNTRKHLTDVPKGCLQADMRTGFFLNLINMVDTLQTKEIDITVCDGKYRVLADFGMRNFRCLRYGEEWRDLTGDGMVLALCHKIQELQEELKDAI